MNNLNKNTTTKLNNNYHPKKDRSLTFLMFSVLGLFMGIGACIGFYSFTLIDIYTFSKFFVAFTVIGFLIPLKYYQKWLHFIKYEAIIFNVIGMGPFFSGLFLCLNFFLSSNPHTEKYKIEKIYIEGKGQSQALGIILEKNIFSGEPKITGLKDIHPKDFVGNSYLKLTIANGLFGFDVITEKRFVK